MSDFLAEARIVVRPDTTAFRAELEAQLRAITAKPVTIPVVAAVAPNIGVAASASQAAAAGIQEVAAATELMAAEQAKATASTVRLSTAENSAALAAQKLAFAQSEVIGASSAVASAQITLTRATAAVVASQKAVGLAIRSNNAALVTSTQETLRLAAAEQVNAKTALNAARAEATRAASTAQASKGVVAQIAALLGLRAGTLAASSAFIGATVAVLGFSKAVQSAAELETELKVFQVNASATADQMERVDDAAKQLGRDITLPGVTAGIAAKAMTELAKAGLSVEDSIAGARGALQLATAAQIDISASTGLVAGALNAFQLEGRDAVKVADLLAGAAKESQGNIEDLALGLQQVQGTAEAFGVSIEDTVTALTILTKSGLSARQAGTGLNVALIRLATNKKAQEFVTGLGLKIRDLNHDIRPQVFAELGAAMQGMSKEAQQAAVATLFGRDALKSILPLIAAGADGFQIMNAAVTEAGLSLEASRARTSGLQGDMENLSNQVSGLGLTVGEVAKGPLSLLVKTMATAVGTLNDAAIATVDLGRVMKDTGEKVAAAIPFFDQAASSIEGIDFGKLVKFSPPLIATTAFTLGMNKLGVGVNKAGKEMTVFGGVIDSLGESLNGLLGALKGGLGELVAQLPKDAGLGVTELQNIVTGFDAQQVRAQIKGDSQALLESLNTEQEFLVAQLQRDFVKRRPALQRALEQALLGTVNEIDKIQKQAQTESERVKQEAQQNVRKREADLLSGFATARDRQQNAIAVAEQTRGVKDDIKEQLDLAALVRIQIAAVRKRISEEGGRAAALVALRAIQIQITGRLKELAQQQREQRQAQRDALIQGIDLDIELASITDNQALEVRRRNEKIKVLTKALNEEARLHSKTTLAYKEIRNQIEREKEALKEIQKEKQQSNNAFGQASFEFLQAQQGFASSLLGNLIPSGATAGLVGGGAPVQSALQPVAGAADARATSGVTAGQGNTTNAILRGILEQLKEMNGETKAPEATWQRRMSWSMLDGVGGG